MPKAKRKPAKRPVGVLPLFARILTFVLGMATLLFGSALAYVAFTQGQIDRLKTGFCIAGIMLGAFGLAGVWSSLFGDDDAVVVGVVVGLLSALLDAC